MRSMSEVRTPQEDTIQPHDDQPEDEEYDGPDPDDARGGASDEDQGT